MNPNTQFERDLEEWLQAEAPASAPAGFHATVMDRARTLRQRPGWASSLPARRFGRGRGITLLAAAALLLVGGALAAGSGLLKLPSLVPPVPVPTPPVAVASPSPAVETPSPVVSPSTAETPWITGQELMDALSATYGYRWSPFVDSETSTVTSMSSDQVNVGAPFDRPAEVRVAADTNKAAGVGLHADRIAQALAPDAAPWIQEAITQGLGADWDSFATTPSHLTSVSRAKVMQTASGAQVGVTFNDPEVWGHYLEVTFRFPPPIPRLEPHDGGVVLYDHGREIWAVNPDGTDPHVLLDADAPLWWSADGSRLFYNDGYGSLFAIDTDGSPPVRIGNRRDNPLCPVVVADDNCEASDDISVSPDGMRLAYKFEEGRGLDNSAIAILDVASGQVTRLGSTRGDDPSWSPDGTRLVFGCGPIGPVADGICLVNFDGSDLRQILPAIAGDVSDPQWSPDGSSILFKVDGNGRAELFTIGPDGAGLRSLTSDGLPDHAYWTRDGRIVFIRMHPETTGELWIMDADGKNATRLDTTVAAQTAAGCLICPYPDEQGFLIAEGHGVNYRYWQPTPEGQP